ncbi:retrovirus-related pol polyprotein from transposon TNT 1-94 [Tanacetum coccineum]
MADMNILANDVLAEQAPTIAPLTRTDDQILPIRRWVPIGKSNYVLDVLKSQRNPIFKMVVAILKNTNFFRAFKASSTIPAIYIQQLWETMCYDSTTGIYSCQLYKQCNVSAMSVNDLYQPWRAILSMINMCLTGKTVGHDRPRHPVLQILWGIIHSSNIDYAERIWEEFVQSIQTFLTDKKRLTMTSRGKKKFVGKDGREVFGMSIPDALLTDSIKRAPYYDGYLAHVAEYQQYLDGEHGMAEEGAVPESPTGDKASKPKSTSSQPPKPKPTPTKPSKVVLEKKQKLVKETPDEPSPAKRSKAGLVGKRRKPKSPLKLVDEFAVEGVPISEPRIDDEDDDYQRVVELSLKDLEAKNQGPARTVVIREPDFGRFQPLPEVQGKGKEKVIEEQAARDLLTLHTPKEKSHVD